MGIDRVEIRRRNMIPKEAYPYQTPVMVEYDSGDPKGCLEKALVVADWAGFAERKSASASKRQAARHRPQHLRRGLWAWRPRA